MGKYLDSFDIIFLSFSSKATKQDDARGFIRFKKHRGKVGFHYGNTIINHNIVQSRGRFSALLPIVLNHIDNTFYFKSVKICYHLLFIVKSFLRSEIIC